MTDDRKPSSGAKATDVLFRRFIVVGTALSLAAAYGWLACFDRQPSGDFYWRWSGLLWMFIGFGSGLYFWRKIWPIGDGPGVARSEMIKGSAVLLVPCLWWMTLPLRFLSGKHFQDVAIGLAIAAVVLAFGVWMVTRLIKGFERSDAKDLNALNSPDSDSK
jgi:hypothetical protein